MTVIRIDFDLIQTGEDFLLNHQIRAHKWHKLFREVYGLIYSHLGCKLGVFQENSCHRFNVLAVVVDIAIQVGVTSDFWRKFVLRKLG